MVIYFVWVIDVSGGMWFLTVQWQNDNIMGIPTAADLIIWLVNFRLHCRETEQDSRDNQDRRWKLSGGRCRPPDITAELFQSDWKGEKIW